MRITFRDKYNKNYWTKKQSDTEADETMKNGNKYPLKYSKLNVKDKNKITLSIFYIKFFSVHKSSQLSYQYWSATRVTALPHPAYQRGSLPRLYRKNQF